MSGIELVLAFLAGVVMGAALDRFVLPLLVALAPLATIAGRAVRVPPWRHGRT